MEELRERLEADDIALEAHFAEAIAMLSSGQIAQLQLLWQRLETVLVNHFAFEERYSLPNDRDGRMRDTVALLMEHRHLRNRLVELAVDLANRTIRVEDLRNLRQELRAHTRRKQELLCLDP